MFGWAIRPQNISGLPWKSVALSISLWLFGLTVDVRATLRVKRTQILLEVLIFLLREKSILVQNAHALEHTFHSAVTEERISSFV